MLVVNTNFICSCMSRLRVHNPNPLSVFLIFIVLLYTWFKGLVKLNVAAISPICVCECAYKLNICVEDHMENT
jgi:hypothetical protein